MSSTTKQLTILTREIDTSHGPYSAPLSLSPFSPSTRFSLSFIEQPCKCAPTMVCIPIIATLELRWTGTKMENEKGLKVKKGSLSFERVSSCGTNAKKEKVSVGIKGGTFPESEEGSIKASSFVLPGRERVIRVKLELEVEVEESKTTSLSRTLDLLDGRATMDVCLVFPQERNRRLFASSTALSQISPYWRAQLSTREFSEELLQSLDLTEDSRDEDSDFEASDNEQDDTERSSDRALVTEPPPIPEGVRTIPIYGTSYTTYRALLTWLYTGSISFAPLTSTFPHPSRQHRRSSISLSLALNPSDPITPCSPKSLYILSHFLSIDELSTIALKAYLSNLDLENVLEELFSRLGGAYEEVREGILSWILEEGKGRWEVLRKGREVREWRERIRKEGISEVDVAILFRLSGIAETV